MGTADGELCCFSVVRTVKDLDILEEKKLHYKILHTDLLKVEGMVTVQPNCLPVEKRNFIIQAHHVDQLINIQTRY